MSFINERNAIEATCIDEHKKTATTFKIDALSAHAAELNSMDEHIYIYIYRIH